MPVAIDTLKATQRLKSAGFSENQTKSLVATFAGGITENLATKDDIALVRKEMEVLGKDIGALDTKIDTSIAAVQKDIKALDTKMDTSIAALDTKTDTSFAALDTKIDTSIAALDTKIDTSIAAVQKDIKALDTKIDTSFVALDAKIDTSINNLRGDMTIRLGGIVLAGFTALRVIENYMAN